MSPLFISFGHFSTYQLYLLSRTEKKAFPFLIRGLEKVLISCLREGHAKGKLDYVATRYIWIMYADMLKSPVKTGRSKKNARPPTRGL